MRILVQRVRSASVAIAGERVAAIGRGALLLVGVGRDDTVADAVHLAGKTRRLRIFDDTDGRMNLPIDEVGGSFLAVSQFTLYADCRRGNRPSYVEAAAPEIGQALYERYVEELERLAGPVATGVFGAQMLVALENDGPVSLLLESSGR
jgi:D-aminoacyl-tRNA deacylase